MSCSTCSVALVMANAPPKTDVVAAAAAAVGEASISATLADATAELRKGLDDTDVVLTPNQQKVITHIVDQNQDVMYIDRTGAGKSETYFTAAKLLRKADIRAGPVIVITPLVVLIVDQVRRAKAFGLKAEGHYSETNGCSSMVQSSVSPPIRIVCGFVCVCVCMCAALC